MPSVEYDLRYLQAGASVLENYLLSGELFWPVGSRPPANEPAFPRLTLGGLLLARQRLSGRTLDKAQQAELTRIDQQLEVTRTRWKTAWGQKAGREFRSRLNLWRDFLEEYRQNPYGNSDRYSYEVRLRVMLHLLREGVDAIPSAEIELLAGLDQLLHALLAPGEFIWEAGLQDAFPHSTYWYLYGNLPGHLSE